MFTVHAMKPGRPGAVEVIYTDREQAVAYAKNRSTDWNVLSASVTSFQEGQLGTRRPVCWFVDGEEQAQRFEREIFPSGRLPLEDWPTELLIERFIDLNRSHAKSTHMDGVHSELRRRLTREEIGILLKRTTP